jgi:hypothetical protein
MVTLEQLVDRWRRDDRGPATLVTVIAMVAFLLIFSVLLQTALFFHGRDVANSCAEKALKNTRSQYGNQALGTAAAYACIAQAGAGDLQIPVVLVSKNIRETTVNITGKAPSLVPGLEFPIVVNHTKPTERVTKPGGIG